MSARAFLDELSAALRIARNIPGTSYRFYDDEIRERLEREKQVETLFHPALEAEEFQIFYQPKVEMRRYQLSGAEALCRWFHDGKMVMPGDFIPVLEGNGSICELDYYVLEHTCQDLRKWMDKGKKIVKVSVNLSRCHLGDPDLLPRILGIIDRYEIPHWAIEIELTETTTDVSFAEMKKLVEGLKEKDISCSVDDFGVGYSSMSLLSEMPWGVVKIDRSFIPVRGDDEQLNRKRETLLKSVISIAESMAIPCIAEGVETLDQAILLKSLGCFMAQGFYFDRPMPRAEFEKRLG